MKTSIFTKTKIIGIISGILMIIISSIFFITTDFYYFLLGTSVFIGGLPFFISIIMESKSEREKDEMFLEFARDLVEGVRAGTPISKSIANIRTKNYGNLNPHIRKLANQIALGIPIQTAFQTFARDTSSKTISRAITIISESEKAGGRIEAILESVAHSVAQSDKLKKERRAAMYTLVVQGYIIFLIFIVIMLVMQFKILPIAPSLNMASEQIAKDPSSTGALSSILPTGETATPEELARPFIWLLVVQGFFIGLVIGKLSEGRVMSGLKHSFVLVVISLWINAGAKLFLG
jgi:archaeal flagellar protein FlaJ